MDIAYKRMKKHMAAIGKPWMGTKAELLAGFRGIVKVMRAAGLDTDEIVAGIAGLLVDMKGESE